MQGLTLAAGTHATIYVNGNVSIDSNVSYGSWTSVSQIPSFTLIASGNIYIAPSVTTLSGTSGVATLTGTYVSDGGTIYTCDQDGSIPDPLYPTCNNQLTVYGSFIGTNIDYMRTGGTLGLASSPSSSTCQSADPNAAEVFCYTPALWLGTPGINNGNLDAIGELPPIL